MTGAREDITVEEDLRARGLDPEFVKFGRLVGKDLPSPLDMTVSQFKLASIGGRALDAADTLFCGLEQQLTRMCEPPPEDEQLSDVLKQISDAEVTLVLLLRFRRAAVLIRMHVPGCDRLEEAIAAFDAAVPDLKHLRDTWEHFDDYILGKGRHEPPRGTGRSYTYRHGDAPIVQRYDRTVDLGKTIRVARHLYEQMYEVAVGHRPHLLEDPRKDQRHGGGA